MAAVQKNVLSTLVTRYKLHPEFLDIYVEGKFDKEFLEYVIERANLQHDVKVYEISTVDVPNELIETLNKNNFENWLKFKSNKHRIIALSCELSEKLSKGNVFGLIDADCDRVLKNIFEIRHLKYTFPTCMEAYFLSSKMLKSFITFQCKLSEEKVQDFLKIANLILPVIFTMRAVNEQQKLNSAVISYTTATNKKGELSSFNKNKYIESYISTYKLQQKKEIIENSFANIFNSLELDVSDKCNGHDFVDLLFAYIKEEGSMKFQGQEINVLEHGNRLLTSTVNASDFMNFDPFVLIDNAIKNKNLIWN